MEKAYAKRWLILAGVALVATLLLAALVTGPALARGRYGQTSPNEWGHGGMMGGWGYEGRANGISSGYGRHGMMPYHGAYPPWQGVAGEERCPGGAYTPYWTGAECLAADASEYGNRDCPGTGERWLPMPGNIGLVPYRNWLCPGWGPEGSPPSDGSGTELYGCGNGDTGRRGIPYKPYCDSPYDSIPEPSPGSSSELVAPEGVSFQADVQPILDARCVFCHGNSGGLSLARYSGIIEGGKSGPVLVPGDPSNSRLIRYVESGYMPLRRPPLSPAQIQTLANWIASGVPDN